MLGEFKHYKTRLAHGGLDKEVNLMLDFISRIVFYARKSEWKSNSSSCVHGGHVNNYHV